MNSKSCDTCKDNVDDYDFDSGKDFGEYKDEVKCIDCIQEYKKDYPYDFEVAEKSWKNSTITEKAEYAKKGNISNSVIIFTERELAPHWENISEMNQWILLEVMADTKGTSSMKNVNKSIFKYEIKIEDYQIVMMPKNAVILCTGVQYEKMCLWALVDPKAEMEKRRIIVKGTGHTVDEKNMKYIGTNQLMEGHLVWHIFEDVLK